MWVTIFNNSKPGSDTRKNVLREISNDQSVLHIEDIGFIHHNAVAKNQFSYSIGPKQLIVKDPSGNIRAKISFGKITRMDTMRSDDLEYIKLTVTK